MSDAVISVENLGKQYRLGKVGTGTLAHDLNRWWHRMRGKEDPYLKLGEVNERGKKGSSELVWALKDVNFRVNKGEVLGIIGKNGAGKSTLLKILSRTTSPTTGTVKIKGKVASLLEVGTGFHPELSGRENMFLNGAILGMTRNEIKRKFDEIVDFSGVERYIDTPVKRYSSGMYVRLAFAVAAHLEPEILILDEVLAVGDMEFQKKCLGKMKDVAAIGRTVLFVSHNLTAVRSLCTKAVLLSNGSLISEGPAPEIIDQYMNDAETGMRHSFSAEADAGKEAQIMRIYFRNNEGIECGEVDLNAPFSVHIEYIIREAITGLTAGFSVTPAKDGEALIVSNEAELEPERLKSRAAGYYTNTVQVPARMLNSGRYRIRVGITSQRNIYDVIDDVFLNVSDSVGIVQMLGFERKNAMLSLQLPWTTKRVIHENT